MSSLARSSPGIRVALLAVAFTLATSPRTESQPQASSSERIRQAIAAVKPEGKLDTALDRLLDGEEPVSNGRVAASVHRGRLAVALSSREEDTDALESVVAATGGRVLHSAPGLLEVRLTAEQLATVVADGRVLSARALVAPAAANVGDATRLGGAASHDVAAAFGVPEGLDGSGIRVGIIDVGFEGYGALIGIELPPPTAVRCYLDFGEPSDRFEVCENPPPLFLGSLPSHGTAVAESLVSVAPDVELYLANPASPLDLRATVEWMVEQGVQVINYSMYRIYEGPGDGTSPLADSVYQTIDRAAARSVVWVGAAGNLARRHWRGPFTDVDADALHEFTAGSAGNCVMAGDHDLVVASLRWDDVWAAPSTDLDLVLLRNAEPVAISADRQDGVAGQLPLESLSFAAETAGEYCFVVTLAGGAPPAWLQLASFRHELATATPEASVAAPADAASPGAMAVGAAPWFDPSQIELFSSWGPTADGRLKPDLVGLDRLLSDSLGGRAFVGTSQAAPHVSGLVALTRQAMPSLGAAGVADLLTAAARAPEGAAPEAWGHGLARFPGTGDPVDDDDGETGCDGSTSLCLGGGRFALSAQWTAADGRRGSGVPRQLTADSGTFSFFEADNVEVLAKVLDGCEINGRHWLYAGGLTDLAVDLVLEDTLTGEKRTYRQPNGAFETIRDVTALRGCETRTPAGPASGHLDVGSWSPDVELASGFRLSVRFTAGAQSETAIGQHLGDDSAAFSFFDRENVELVIKVLDGRAINGAWWVFASGTTDVGVEIRILNAASGETRSWTSPAGRPFVPVLDVDAFASCLSSSCPSG
ncbi:MAG TPA: S8 family serine peptidase [Thermoanaerobaculia bacterium]|nr:S8 family serine peptidase [Thermoanaerobaculia bacterium]